MKLLQEDRLEYMEIEKFGTEENLRMESVKHSSDKLVLLKYLIPLYDLRIATLFSNIVTGTIITN